MKLMNTRKNVSVAKGHGYSVEKVKYAMDFLKNQGRNTTLEEWVKTYNYIKGANETVVGCKRCMAAKYTASVRNYAQYGYLTLINEGHKPEEFTDAVEEPCTVFTDNENSTEQEKVPELNETNPETCNEEEQVPELASTVIDEDNVEVSEDTVKEVAEEAEKPAVKRNKGGRPRKSAK